ncbi:MAG: alpha-amylase [Bacteroidales bacterium]|nr:alpha-amylase [Bacteroidales bacterium]
MRRAIFPLACLLFVASQAFSCKEKEPEIVQQTLSVSPTSLSFEPEDASAKMLNVSSNAAWGVAVSDSWIKIDKNSGDGNSSIAVTVQPNTGKDRAGTITVKGVSSSNVKAASDVTVSVSQKGRNIVEVKPSPASFDGNKRSSTTYQLLIYSFADSDGDGIGDFKGIQNKLDYLDGLGVTGIWLSPAHPSDSYHAYDVTDYYAVNPLYGTEQDFKNLIDAAHAKGIKIYMDYVLNHSGKGNEWFKQALADPSSKYRDYYFFSSNPKADYSKFPMLKGTTYQAGEWKQATSGSPKLKVSKTDEAVTKGTATWNLYMWQDGVGDKTVKFVDKGDGTYYLVMDITGKWGVLVRKYADWQAGSKFGASGNGTLTEGQAMSLVADGADMWFSGTGRYKIELSDVSTETLYYMGCFSDWMPDLNYGDVSQAENNACFQDLAASADKWINLGVDGFRLDAVKHICGGINSFSHSSNQTLLKKWYDHCNATYHTAGHSDNIFMVAEEWDGHNTEKNYYKSLTSCFEFEYFGALTNALNGSASGYATSVSTWINDHNSQRGDAITSIFMTNHDQDRAAESLGKSPAKEKQAAAMMLTTSGKPFIYQGEELGYWGKKDGGDEYVRTPIMWDKAGNDCARKGVNNKVNSSMLTSSISVEAQSADNGSLLNVYKTFSKLRNTYPALADGVMTNAGLSGSSIASWYMTSSDGQKLLVIHNVSGTSKTTSVSDDMSKPIALLGTASYDGTNLTLGANSSVVFQLK